MELLMIVVSLIGLMFFAYRGYSIIWIAPFFAIVASFGTEHCPIAVYSEIYMIKAAEYIKTFYPVFLFGAIFAKLMEDGGMANSVARKIVSTLGKDKAVFAVLLGCGVLTYGGLSVFVVAFVMYPFGALLFKQADIPKRLLPATLWMGIFTYGMIALPGTPQIQNIIPTSFFGTTTWAGIFTGIIGAILYFLLAWVWITYRHHKLHKQGEGYGKYVQNDTKGNSKKVPHWALSALPLVMVVIINLFISNPFAWSWAYQWDENSLLSIKKLGLSLVSPSVAKVQAIWSINLALFISSVVAILIGRKYFRYHGSCIASINMGAMASTSAVLNVASGYAFGCVITSLPGFLMIKELLLNLSIGDGPLISAIITTNVMTAVTGSASGGLTIALEMLGNEWLAWAQNVNMAPEILHRIVCMASCGFDSVTHCGALVTLLAVCGLTHSESYYDIFILMLLKTTIAFICLGIFMITGLP